MAIPTTPPSGFRDFLPLQMSLRLKTSKLIEEIYRSFGFEPISTSMVEDLQTLIGQGGGENEKLIFKIMKRGDELKRAQAEQLPLADLGLRFDLTLPLARYYTKNGSQLSHPFKAFHLGPVWRAERAQKGRFREFTQCDVDIIGSDSWGAEVDVISAILTVFKVLGIEGVKVHLNDRRYVDHCLEKAGIAVEKRTHACVIIDKLDKMDFDKVLAELAIEVGPKATEALSKTLLLTQASDEYKSSAENGELRHLGQITKAVSNVIPGAEMILTPNLMRGMGYYTGTIFEFRHHTLSGSLGGGGRYDNLTQKFGGQAIAACGGSIGFERLMLILEEKNTGSIEEGLDAVVTVFSEELRNRSTEVANHLRCQGLKIDLFPGNAKLKNQFKYADHKKARYALVIGPDEAARNVIQVKNLKTGDEQALSVEEIPRLISHKLK